MTGTRSILVVGVVVAVVGLVGCRDQSDQAVRTGDGATTSGQAPASAGNPAVASPSGQAPDGASPTPGGAGVAESVLVLLGPAGLSVPGIGTQLGFFGSGDPSAPGGSAGTSGGGTGTGGQGGSAPGTPGVPVGPGIGTGGNSTGGGTNTNTGGNSTGGTNTNTGGGSTNTGGGSTNTGGGTNTNTAAGFCAPAKSLDSALSAVGAAREPGALRSAVARARSAFTTARAAAPANLIGDVDVLAGAYGQLFGSMEAAGYDLNRLSVGAFSPLLTPEVKASSGRLRDFVNNDC